MITVCNPVRPTAAKLHTSLLAILKKNPYTLHGDIAVLTCSHMKKILIER